MECTIQEISCRLQLTLHVPSCCNIVLVKYGQGSDLVRAGTVGSGSAGGGGGEKAANNYAMFSSPIGQQSLADVHRSQELRRRPGTGMEDSQSDNGMTNMSNPNHHHINGNMSMNMNMKASMRDENGKPYSSKNSNNNNNSSSSSSGGGSGTSDRYGRGYGKQSQLQLQQQQRPNRDMKARLQGAEKVEKAITQVFTMYAH